MHLKSIFFRSLGFSMHFIQIFSNKFAKTSLQMFFCVYNETMLFESTKFLIFNLEDIQQ